MSGVNLTDELEAELLLKKGEMEGFGEKNARLRSEVRGHIRLSSSYT